RSHQGLPRGNGGRISRGQRSYRGVHQPQVAPAPSQVRERATQRQHSSARPQRGRLRSVCARAATVSSPTSEVSMFAAILTRLSPPSRCRAVKRQPSFRPQLTRLEDRTLPSTYTVMNLNDSGPGSLRAAIASGDDTITFAKGLHGTIPL